MRSVRCAWRSSNRKMSWGFVHANMPFIESASSSGWRWGKCARCATCQCCSWPSRRAAQRPPCPYNSPCPASRTWCSHVELLPYVTTPTFTLCEWTLTEQTAAVADTTPMFNKAVSGHHLSLFFLCFTWTMKKSGLKEVFLLAQWSMVFHNQSTFLETEAHDQDEHKSQEVHTLF